MSFKLTAEMRRSAMPLNITITEDGKFRAWTSCEGTRKAGIMFLEDFAQRLVLTDDQLVALVGELCQQLPDLPPR